MIPSPNYTYISSNENLSSVKEWLIDRRYVVFDIETGPHPSRIQEWEKNSKIGLDPYRNQIVTLQVGDKDRQFVIDVRTVTDLGFLFDTLQDENIAVIGVNLRFDWKNMKHHYGCNMNSLGDLMIMEQVIRNGIFPVKQDTTEKNTGGAVRKFSGMKALAKRYLGLDIDKDHDLRISLWRTAPNEFDQRQLEYMSNDCVFPDLIARCQKQLINERGLHNVIKLENSLVPVVGNMELVGLPFDVNSWISLLQEATEDRLRLEKELDKFFGVAPIQQFDIFGENKTIRPINYDSPAQMAKALHKKGIKGFVGSDGKALSTATPIIKQMKIRGHFPVDLADIIIEYRKVLQKETSYGENFIRAIHPITGRIHSDYTQTCLVTGRMSASPGVQTIPTNPRYRASFKAPDGYTFIVLDASQIEARLSCDLTGDAEGIQVFKRGGDIYKEDGQKFYNREIDKNTKEGKALRQKAKNAWLGLSYGQGKPKFHDFSTVFLDEDISREDTDLLYDKFFELHYQMKKVMDEWSERVDPLTSTKFIVDDVVEQFINKDQMYEKLMKVYVGKYGGNTDRADKVVRKLVDNCNQLCYAETVLGRKRYFRPDYLGYWTAGRNFCVDTETEILTQGGWKRYDEIAVGTQVLTKDPNSEELEWQPILKMNIIEDYQEDLVSFETRSFSALTTRDHRWLVDTKTDTRFISTDEFDNSGWQRIHRTGAYSGEEEYTDNFIKLVGWFLTDGHIKTESSVCLDQSFRANPEKVALIDTLLLDMGICSRRSGPEPKNKSVRWTLCREVSQQLTSLFPNRIATPKFINRISGRQATLLVETMILGDGHEERVQRLTPKNKTTWIRHRTLCTQHKLQADMFSFVCMLAGHATSVRWVDTSMRVPKTSNKMKNSPISKGHWIVSLLERNRAQIVNKNKKIVPGLGRTVWCPTVENSTFVCRRDGKNYITGNCVQGQASDIQKAILLEYQKMHWKEGWDANVILVVHDELITLVREDQAEEVLARQIELGNSTGQMFLTHVPMKMEGGVTPIWRKF